MLLVGDVRQHQAVEAGSPFQQLQEHGMTTAALTEIVRQPDEEQKKIVENLAARNTPEAVAELISRGKVIEIEDERERFEVIAQDYAKNPTGTLVISPANRERSQLKFASNIKMTERYAKLAKQHIARTSGTARELWKILKPQCANAANVG